MGETRMLLWAGTLCAIVCATPTARDLWREWQARRAALAEQMGLPVLVEHPIPRQMLRELYDDLR